jgi:predicted nucleic acid-binding protein
MSLYLDTSCLLKVLFPEPETRRVMQLISAEEEVVVSTLARVETTVQVHARVAGGHMPRAAGRLLLKRLDSLLHWAPYSVAREPADFLEVAEAQARALSREGYCPSLDRLHLAVMQALGVTRLFTNDDAQARAARALGFTVIVPR